MPSKVDPKIDLDEDLTEEQLLATLDFSDIEVKYKVELPDPCECVVVVDNLPIVDSTKEKKLLDVIKSRVFKNFAIKQNGLNMPKDSSGKSKGFMFIEFETPELAVRAVKDANGYKLDKSHVLSVNKFSDIDLYTNLDDTFVPPPQDEFVEKEHLKGWLTESKARDQWVMMRGNDTAIYWNNKSEAPSLAYRRETWSDVCVIWSPLGSYLLTFHKQGVALWGGATFKQIMKFPHVGVKTIDFSPNERYLVTWSNEPVITPEGQAHNLIVWDIITGRLLRSFPMDASQQQPATTETRGRPALVKFDWPVFKWSHDDKYLAKMVPGAEGLIQVYETPSMGLLDKKSLKVDNIISFNWCPNEHVLAYYTPESDNIPARITLTRLPSRETVRTKNLVNVLEAKMFWQSNGDFLLVKVERAKTKKQTVTNFEIFRMREKGIPVDVLEFRPEETVGNVFFEPNGNRFAVITQEANAKLFVYFYEIVAPPVNPMSKAASAVAGEIKLLKKLEKKGGVNQVLWSPKGRFCVLASIRAFQGELEFWDIDELVMMGSGEHYMCTDVEWDPTGRYVISSVSFWVHPSDTGFQLWSFTGQNLLSTNIPQFKQISWRPRPPTMLSKEQIKNLKKNMKKYSKDFDEEDAKGEMKSTGEQAEMKRRLLKEWRDYRSRCEEEYEKEREQRIAIYGFDPDAKVVEDEDVEELVEEIVDEVEEIIG